MNSIWTQWCCNSLKGTKGWQSVAVRALLDFPAGPIHPPDHAPHSVPPQNGDVRVLAVVVSSPLVDGQSAVQPPQVPPQAWIGDDDYPLPSAFARCCHVCFDQGVFWCLVAQQRDESIPLQGAVVGLAHGQSRCQSVALKKQCYGEDDRHRWPCHGEDLPGGAECWLQRWASFQWSLLRCSDLDVVSPSFISFRTSWMGHVASSLMIASPVVIRKLVEALKGSWAEVLQSSRVLFWREVN